MQMEIRDASEKKHKFYLSCKNRSMSYNTTLLTLLTDDEPNMDFGDLIIPAMEWRIVSNLETLSFLS